MKHVPLRQDIIAAWMEGLTASEIAAKMNISRGSVVGILYRAREAGQIPQEHLRKKVHIGKRAKRQQALKAPKPARETPSKIQPTITHQPKVEAPSWQRPYDVAIASFYKAGHTFGDIAKHMKLDRNTITSRLTVMERRGFLKRRAPDCPKPGPIVAVPPVFEGIPLLELQPHHCRWALGGLYDPPKGFCGAQRKEGSSYCEDHHARAHVKHTPRVRVAAKKALPNPKWEKLNGF